MLSFKTNVVFYMFNRLVFRTSLFLALDCLLRTLTRQIVERKARKQDYMCNSKDGHNQFSLCSGPYRES